MATYPKLDLPEIPSDLELRLQDQAVLNHVHDLTERASYFYSVAHTAVRLGTEAHIDDPSLLEAVDIGAKIFEVVGYFVAPERTYMSVEEQQLTFRSAQRFIASVRNVDEFIDATEYARHRMSNDAEHLTEFVTEVAGKHVQHDPVALRYAVQTAAAIRGMQIFVDRQLDPAV